MDLKFNNSDIQNFFRSKICSDHPIIKALKSGKLIIFVGAGMSVHLDIPGWRDFALKYLALVYKNKSLTFMNYKTMESLKSEDTRKLLSICKFVANKNMTILERNNAFKKWFEIDIRKVKEKRLYEKLYNLNAIYITTNYDNALDLLAEQIQAEEFSAEEVNVKHENISVNPRGTVYYDINNFTSDILKIGNVIHIHGSIKNTDDLVISYEDYINRYGRDHADDRKFQLQKKYSDFLSTVFKKDYVVLFIGYGLEEFEILQYLFEDKLKEERVKSANDRYFLLSCYSDDYFKISYLADYYKDCYEINLIPYDMTDNGYEKIEEFLDYLNELKSSDEQYVSNKTDELKLGLRLIEEI